MKIAIFLSDFEDSIVLNHFKNSSRLINTKIKVIDSRAKNLKEYLYELKNTEIKIVIIKYYPEIDLKDIFIDLYVFENADIENTKNISETFAKIVKHSSKNSYLIINSDLINELFTLPKSSHIILDYGLNMRATITASSITDEKFFCCVQRNIMTIEGLLIEPQEFAVTISSPDDVYSVLCFISLLLVCNVKKNLISGIKF